MSWHDGEVYLVVLFLKGAFRNLWPLIAWPAAAALIGDRLGRLAPRAAGGWLAAVFAALPGAVGLVVIFNAMEIYGKVLTWRGAMVHWITPLIAAGFAAWAIRRSAQRLWQVARLFALAQPARARLAAVAGELGLRALEIPSAAVDCFVAGVLRPTVFISTGALARLGDAELRAALCHERAHLAGRDTLSLMLLGFLRDLAPWGRGAALDAFRAGREAAADRAAAQAAGRFNLASALLVLARPGPRIAGEAVIRMARADTFRWRMQALLEGEETARLSRGDWARLAAGTVVCASLLGWPAIQIQLMELCCHLR